jgi:succinoglycan biosynthesis transport protein ExoP
MTFQQLLLSLRARYKVALIVFLLTVGAATGVSLWLPKQYTASTAVVVDVKSPDPVAGMVLQGMVSPTYMTTQIDIINSDRVAEKVVKLLKQEEDPVLKQAWQDQSEGKGNFRSWLAERLQRSLDVRPSHESNVINIGFTGNDPVFAAAVANAFAQAYIDVNLELKVEPARQYATWFEEQTKALRDNLEKAQAKLSKYRQETGIVATDERVDYETARLSELSSQLTLVQGQTNDSSSKRTSAGGSESLVEVMQSPLINSLKADIARLDGKLQESNITLGPNHPQTQRTESELASLRSRLAIETQQISNVLGTSVKVGKQKEKELSQAIAAQKARVLTLNNQRDEGRVLVREVESAQRAFETVSQRSAQSRLESLTIQTNVSILNAASEPIAPSKPRVALNILASIVLGAFLGASLAIVLELFDRRVRSQEDLVEATGLPILATIGASGGSAGAGKGLFKRRSAQPLAA